MRPLSVHVVVMGQFSIQFHPNLEKNIMPSFGAIFVEYAEKSLHAGFGVSFIDANGHLTKAREGFCTDLLVDTKERYLRKATFFQFDVFAAESGRQV